MPFILFDKDWNDYPDAIIHYSTSNKSFLEYVALLNKMGVHNSAWPLALHNPDLEFVDPHSENLTFAQKQMIAEECSENIWYIVREVLRIAPSSGEGSIQFKANRGNMAMIWSYYAGITYAAIQPRQTGKSVGGDTISIINLVFLCLNTEMLLVTKDSTGLGRNIRRIKEMLKRLPSYLYPTTNKDLDNSEKITLLARNNYIIGLLAQKDRKAAELQGRGMTSPHIQYDETSFIYNVSTIMAAATSSGAAARRDAREAGEPHGILYTTTTGDIEDREVKFVHDFIMAGTIWDERIYLEAIDREDLRQLVLRNGGSKSPLINGTFNHRQLGFTDEWIYNEIAEAKLSVYQANMEYFCRWQAGKQSNLIPGDLQDVLNSNIVESDYIEVTRDKTAIFWQVSETEVNNLVVKDSKILLGLDTSEAVNRDAIAGIMVDAEFGHTLARFTVNNDNLHDFSTTFLLDLMLRYPNVVLIPEMKNSARGIIDGLAVGLIANDIDPFKRIYNRVVQNGSDSEVARARFEELKRRSFVDVNMFNNRRDEFGFVTSASSRGVLYGSVLFRGLKALAPYIKDSRVISELCSLTEKKGRVDHDGKNHDDHVIAWLLTQWLRYEGRNLDFYGIGHINTTITWNKSEEPTLEDATAEIRDKSIRSMIDKLRKQLEDMEDPSTANVLEMQIRTLYSQLTKPGGYGSIDEIMRGIAERREINGSRNLGAYNFGNIWDSI